MTKPVAATMCGAIDVDEPSCNSISRGIEMRSFLFALAINIAWIPAASAQTTPQDPSVAIACKKELKSFNSRLISAIAGFAGLPGARDQMLAKLLGDCEQRNAAKAAVAVLDLAEQGKTGATVAWTSDTRPGVRGQSVASAPAMEGKRQCLSISDIVIVEGEEITSVKKMCRTPPAARYSRV